MPEQYNLELVELQKYISALREARGEALRGLAECEQARNKAEALRLDNDSEKPADHIDDFNEIIGIARGLIESIDELIGECIKLYPFNGPLN